MRAVTLIDCFHHIYKMKLTLRPKIVALDTDKMLIHKMYSIIAVDQNHTAMVGSRLPDINLSEYSCSIPDEAC